MCLVFDEEKLRYKAIKKYKKSDHGGRQEVKASQALGRNDHCVPILEHSQDNTILSMPYLMSGDLLQSIETHGSFNIKQTIDLAVSMLQALVHLQNHGIVHRDIKLENILLATPRGGFKLTDFGLSCKAEDSPPHNTPDYAGTFPYLSPEMVQRMLGQKQNIVSFATDMWSLAIVIYGAFLGKFPFRSNNEEQCKTAIMHHPISFSHRKLTIDQGPHLQRLLIAMLERNPQKRLKCDEALSKHFSYTGNKPQKPK